MGFDSSLTPSTRGYIFKSAWPHFEAGGGWPPRNQLDLLLTRHPAASDCRPRNQFYGSRPRELAAAKLWFLSFPAPPPECRSPCSALPFLPPPFSPWLVVRLSFSQVRRRQSCGGSVIVSTIGAPLTQTSTCEG